jgi:hypothetical protein
VIDTGSLLGLESHSLRREEASSMPFPRQPPREFTRENIERIPPGQIGCYALLRGLECVYIGKGDIRERLLAHFHGDTDQITREAPTHWVDLVCGDDDECERQLILEYHPTCNQRVG